ncbi:MAG TPA: hypothetical protein VFG95_10220, partial [Nitrospiria bacterium]|nr:hypothetical protein [Nitrospiria bacterium]
DAMNLSIKMRPLRERARGRFPPREASVGAALRFALLLFSVLLAGWITATTRPARAQLSRFQPLLLAFDPAQGRLFAATPGAEPGVSRLLVFSRPGREGTRPEASLDVSGVVSGLSYDPGSKTLFVADATKHALLIFDRFDPPKSTRASRVLKRFTFPTGASEDRGRLFVADAHPGALLVFEKGREIEGQVSPDQTIGPEKSGLNGPFAIALDSERRRLFVSNFDGVLIFDLSDLAATPGRVPLPKGTLARGLAFDGKSKRLYIAAPMSRSYYVYDGSGLEQVRIDGVSEAFPFSIALDPEGNRLYLAGASPEIGVIEQVDPGPTGGKSRSIDRWIRWEDEAPPPPPEAPTPEPPSNTPSVSSLTFNHCLVRKPEERNRGRGSIEGFDVRLCSAHG